MEKSKLDIAKEVIRTHYESAKCGIFNCRNRAGDPMNNIYDDGELSIDICYYYSYFEVFGLSESDYKQLERFYEHRCK